MKLIEDRSDIEVFVNEFYERVKFDSVIQHFFTKERGFSFEQHIPIMCDFWETILLHVPRYSGSPVGKHIVIDKELRMNPEHFERWVSIFNSVIDEFFVGDLATEAKKRADLMRHLMIHKIEYARSNNLIF